MKKYIYICVIFLQHQQYLQKHTVTAAQAWTTRGTQTLNWNKIEYKNLKNFINNYNNNYYNNISMIVK